MKTTRTILSALFGLAAITGIHEREAHAAQSAGSWLLYGHTYGLRNGYDDFSGGYLDTKGTGCEDNKLCVSTATTPSRAAGSGSWMLLSASGKPAGAPVEAGDLVYFKSLSDGDGGYLDTRKSACEDNRLCVSTATTSNRDQGSGTWKVLRIDGTNSGPIREYEDVRLQNGWKSFIGGYLDTKRSGCEGNLLCVSTSQAADRDNGSTHWRLGVVPKNDLQPFARRTDTFCYTTEQPQDLLQNEAATLKWDQYGNLSIVAKGGGTWKWGIGSSTPLVGASAAKVCHASDGKLRIEDSAGQVVWQSHDQTTTGTDNALELESCTLEVVAGGATQAWETADPCYRPAIKMNEGWCVPTSANQLLAWNRGPNGNTELYWGAGALRYTRTGEYETWHTPYAVPGAYEPDRLCFQADGNLVIYDAADAPLWASGTAGKAEVPTELDVNDRGVSLWGSKTQWFQQGSFENDRGTISRYEDGPQSTVEWCRDASAPERILVSGDFRMEWQANGNLVMYGPDGTARWSSNTVGSKSLCFQQDGNLVIYGSSGATWDTGTWNTAGSKLTLDGCTLSLSDGTSTLWKKTGSGCASQLGNGAWSYGYHKRWGDKRFGAEMWVSAAGADANSINNLRSKAASDSTIAKATRYLPTGSVGSGFAEIMGSAGVGGTLFDDPFTVVDLSGYVGNVGSTSNWMSLTLLDHGAVSGTVGYTFNPPDLTATFFDASMSFYVGVPVTCEAEITGTVGAESTLVPYLGGVGISVTPFANLSVGASASVGAGELASVGVEGELTLIDVRTPLSLSLSVSTKQYGAAATLDVSSLSGEIDLFAKALGWKKSLEIASWDGIHTSVSLLNTTGSM
ncbi:hypothetical protein A7982_12880 [Minicystis rosea]|nr:hypothetical protein A7982_12880 [Minicystis rosea]